MITTPEEYMKNLHLIYDENPPTIAILLPPEEKIYQIDLNSRTVHGPEILCNLQDHKSEVLYFVCNRYYDYMDLTNTVCLVRYTNAAGEHHYYPVPFYDITTPNTNRDLIQVDEEGSLLKGTDEELMMFPWCIGGDATKRAGIVSYDFMFFSLKENSSEFAYRLYTNPTTGKILDGMKINGKEFEEEGYKDTASDYQQWVAAVDDFVKNYTGLQWITVE